VVNKFCPRPRLNGLTEDEWNHFCELSSDTGWDTSGDCLVKLIRDFIEEIEFDKFLGKE
jgi:hypothetical protein